MRLCRYAFRSVLRSDCCTHTERRASYVAVLKIPLSAMGVEGLEPLDLRLGYGRRSDPPKSARSTWTRGVETASQQHQTPHVGVVLSGGFRSVFVDGVNRNMGDAPDHHISDLALMHEGQQFLRRDTEAPRGLCRTEGFTGHPHPLHLQSEVYG
jgi:hypothetical protein